MQNLPRVVIAATASNTGKTTVTAGILCALMKKNLSVASFKVGPDYIDPSYHQAITGASCHNLDSWLVGKSEVPTLFYNVAKKADISVIEGVMGLYDGGRGGVSSTAEIAKMLNAPVILIVDAKSMGASAAALAMGFRDYDKKVNFAGVILNRIGSKSHEEMIRDAMEKINIKVFGAIKRDENLHLPHRHLGLVTAYENDEKNNLFEKFSGVENEINIDEIIALANNASYIENCRKTFSTKAKKDIKIAVAKDEAFSFYYDDSLSVLEDFGAEIIYFSPLYDKEIPNCDGIILGGGFPEMFAKELEANKSMRYSIKNAANIGIPIYAECGGYMYLMKSITDLSGNNFDMTGVIKNCAKMEDKLQTVGYVTAKQTKETILGESGAEFRGHEFHFSVEKNLNFDENNAAFVMEKMRTGTKYFAGFANKNILASYLHLHFIGEPNAARNFVKSCRKFKKGELWER